MFQNTVALYGMEVEYIALSECIKEVLWMRRLLKDLGAEQEELTVIYEDNQGQWLWRRTTKHIDIRYHFVCEKVKSDEVELAFEQSKNQLADVFTKSLSSKTLCYFMVRSNVGPKLETSNEFLVYFAELLLLDTRPTRARHGAFGACSEVE
ncbi:Polyprotein [Phytophthora palmivora]|uniref:Polyprotein n=1 Tax=Phytophthora palmivora TaxID=4796 RepID=A0A2P4Y0R7_9STRA|nr:Polyprotein [Phytophthora palmivora]